jgi:hypothetical protein
MKLISIETTHTYEQFIIKSVDGKYFIGIETIHPFGITGEIFTKYKKHSAMNVLANWEEFKKRKDFFKSLEEAYKYAMMLIVIIK